jgi:hypothetical protein
VSLAVFWAPPRPPASVAAARDALAARARRAGVAWLDLSPAPAADAEAPALHRTAIEAYERLRFDEAMTALDVAVAEVERSGGDGLSTADLSDLFLYRGLTEIQLGDAAPAWEDLVRAATIDPARALDPVRFAPRAVEAFQRAQAAVQGRPQGALVVDAPSGCRTKLDGAEVAAGRAQLPYGDHFVLVHCGGRRPWGTRAALAAPELTVAAVPEVERAPAPAELLALGRDRGAARLVAVVAAIGPSAPATLALRRVALSDGRTEAQASVALAPGGAATPDAVAAFERVLAPEPVAAAVAAGPSPRRRWYRQPWLWGVVGAAVATAAILPFAIGDSGPTRVELRPTGISW